MCPTREIGTWRAATQELLPHTLDHGHLFHAERPSNRATPSLGQRAAWTFHDFLRFVGTIRS